MGKFGCPAGGPRWPTAWSGGEWQGSQPGQGAIELGFPGPAPWQMQGETPRLAGDPSDQGEEAPAEGLGGCHYLAQSDASGPAGQVVGHHLDRQPGCIGGKAARGEMVEAHAVLQVPDGILDFGVAAVVGLQFQDIPLPVGDAGVIAVVGEQRQLGAGRGLDPADDEPHRRGIGLATEGRVFSLGHVGGAVHPVGNGRPVLLGYGLNEMAQALVLAHGDGETDLHLSAEGDDGVVVEAAVGPHCELPRGSGVAHPAQGFAQEVGGTPGGVGPALPQPGHEHLTGADGHGQQRVIAPLAGVAPVSSTGQAVAAGTLLGQAVCLADRRIKVDGQRRVAGSGPGGPGPGQQFPAHPVQLTDVAPPEAAQESPQRLPSRKRGWTAP